MGRKDAVQFTLEWAAQARRLGATVTYQSGWESRGNGQSPDYEGGIVHHTASSSSATNPNPTLSVLIYGRSDLSGPLCNVTGPYCTPDRPRLHVIAAYPANHAGASGGRSMGPLPVTNLFNKRVFGLEIDYAGSSPMSSGQYKAATIFAKALVIVLGRSTEYVRAHAETSITGKWDPGYASGRTIDMSAFRRQATSLVTGETPPPAPKEDIDMFLIRNENGTVMLLSDNWAEWVSTAEDHKALMAKLGNHVQLTNGLFDRIVRSARAGSANTAALVQDLADEEPGT